jgi:lysozyme family protein
LDDKAKIMKIQTLLNTKYNTGLKVDGILGQNTLTALSKTMKSTQASVDKFKETFSQMGKDFENKPNPITGAPAATTAAPATGTTAPAATTTAAPAATTTAAPAATTTAQPVAQTSDEVLGTEVGQTQAAPATTTQPALSQTSQQALSGQLTPQQIRQQGRFDQRLARQARRNQRRAGQQ